MMKQTPSATGLLPSRLCRCLLGICVLKLMLFCSLVFEYPQEKESMLADATPTVTTYSQDSVKPAADAYALTPTEESPDSPQSESLPNSLLGEVPQSKPYQSPLDNLPVPRIVSGALALAADDFAMPTPKVKALESPLAPPASDPLTNTRERGIDIGGNNAPPQPPASAQGAQGQQAAQPPAVPQSRQSSQTSSFSDSTLRRQEDLARREQEVLSLKQQMEDRLEELRAVEARVQNMLKEAQGVKDEKTRQLVLMYGNMKPKQAALALEQLDERIAVRILGSMSGKQAGEILSYMKPLKTAKLSELLTRMQLGE